MKHYISLFVIAFSSALLLFSCKPKENMVYLEHQRQQYEQQVQQAVYQGSRLQEGDLLDIKVTAYDEYAVRPFNLHSMNLASNSGNAINAQGAQTAPQGYLVDPDGSIVFPVLGKIFVKGMTKDQLRADLENRLLQYLTDPLVTIRQLNFNITVLGEVKQPGQYTSPTEKVTLFQALGLAGDMTDFAERTKVTLIRNEDGIEQTHVLDFTDKSLVSSPYYYLKQNDVLYVQPDDLKKRSANVDPNRNLIFQIGGIAISVATLIITLTR